MEKPLLHLVFGGRVKDTREMDFEDPDNLDLVGIYPNYKKAYEAWRGVSQRNVDDAFTKYVIVHLHRMLDPTQENNER